MHFALTYAHFFASILFLILGVLIIVKDPRSRLNQACAGIIICFFIWSFSATWIYHPATSIRTARFFEGVGSFGWIFFSTFHLWFAWLFSKRQPVRFMNLYITVLVAMPVVLVVEQWWHAALVAEHLSKPYGWFSVWNSTLWTYLYFVYCWIVVLFGLFLIFDYGRKSDNAFVKHQAFVLLVTGALTLLLGFVVNIIVSMIAPGSLPPIADITSLLWASGLAYVAIRYSMLNITPFIASNRIIATMKDLLFLLDINGYIVSVNVSAQETLEAKTHLLTAKSFKDIIVDDESVRETIVKAMMQKKTYTAETVLACPPGPHIPVMLSTSLIPGTGVVCVAHDISLQKQRTALLREAKNRLETKVADATKELQMTNERLQQEVIEKKQAAAALRESEERFRVIFECAPDGIYLVDLKGNFIDANNEALTIIGYSKDEIVGKNIVDIGLLKKPDISGAITLLAEGNREASADYREITLVRKNGEAIPVEISVHPLKIGDKSLNIGIVRDLSQRKKAENEAEELRQELHHSQKMDAIGRLAGGIAHDFNNLLGGIIGYSGLIRKRLSNQFPAEAEVLQKIIDVARQASERTAQLLAFARKGKYCVEPVNMQELLDDVVELMKHTIDPRITLVKDCKAALVVVRGDRSQLHSALLNLGVNARDALPEGGAIHFSMENISRDENESGSSAASECGTHLKIVVRDNGTGMDEETKTRAFEPFFSTKEEGKGTGLGLPSVYGTVKQHDGTIELESEVGKGTSFIITLPVDTTGMVTEDTVCQSTPEIQSHAGAILVVDDTPLIREMMVETLIDLGYAVDSCENGTDAIVWYEKNYSRCDLVVLDFTMPEVNGKECFHALKTINPSVNAIITSGHAVDGEIDETLKAGARAFLQKPFDIDVLSKTVSEIMAEKRTGD